MNLTNNTSICCSFCNSSSMKKVIDFGEVALAGGFLKKNQVKREKKYPLRLYFCENCFSVQVIDKVNPDILFEDYFYFSSAIKTLRDHFERYADEVVSRFLSPESSTVIEFGCNDGILLKPIANKNIKTVIGVDPASNVVSTIDDSRINVINDFFSESIAKDILRDYGSADMVIANNVYAHIPDIQGVTRAVHDVLNDDGVFIFEVHYLGKVVNEMQYDMIYHEHLYYYSLLSAIKHFERYEMVVFDIKFVPIHAGSIRFYVGKKNGKHSDCVSDSVIALQKEELLKGFDLFNTFSGFAEDVARQKDELMALLTNLKAKGFSVAGYGASGRANTMIQYCQITHEHIDYMIDDAPSKQGFLTPGSHFEIYPRSILESDNAPDYLLVFAWSFFEEIARKNSTYFDRGGKMVVPLPEVKVISSVDEESLSMRSS